MTINLFKILDQVVADTEDHEFDHVIQILQLSDLVMKQCEYF